MAPQELDFVHRYLPPEAEGSGLVLLLLHGTGGSEDDLLPLGRALSRTAVLLSPRGKVLESGMPRFFRRLAEGVFDEEDLKRRTHELADFVAAAGERYGFDLGQVIAVGYSNGANIAGGLLLLRPETLAGAIQLRPMVPFQPERLGDLSGKPVLAAAARHDPLVEPAQSEAWAEMLRRAGAEVTLHWTDAGHGLTQPEVAEARRWLARHEAALTG